MARKKKLTSLQRKILSKDPSQIPRAGVKITTPGGNVSLTCSGWCSCFCDSGTCPSGNTTQHFSNVSNSTRVAGKRAVRGKKLRRK